MRSRSILVLGSANLDLVVRLPRLPAPGETMFGHSFSEVPGGKGLNQAVAAARAGGRVAFAGAIGDDGYGRQLEELLRQEAIDTSALETLATTTGTAHISVVDSGENSIVVVPGANAGVAVGGIHRELIAASDYLVLQLEIPLETVRDAVRIAGESDTFVVLTPAPVAELDDELLQGVDLLVANEHEVVELAGVDDVEAAARSLSERSAHSVLVTLGAEGSLLIEPGREPLATPARRVEAVDTTAAGDTFVGALVAHLGEGGPMAEAIARGTAASSIAVTRPGATSSMPRRTEIEAVIASPHTASPDSKDQP